VQGGVKVRCDSFGISEMKAPHELWPSSVTTARGFGILGESCAVRCAKFFSTRRRSLAHPVGLSAMYCESACGSWARLVQMEVVEEVGNSASGSIEGNTIFALDVSGAISICP
jgi:hypothetical protein